MSTTAEDPFHLRGNYAPVTEEVTATDLPVRGVIPADLDGRYLRNGPNPVTGESRHWFFGDGMIHGVRLRDGRAEWYRNRYVRTPSIDGPDAGAGDLDEAMADRADSKANTHVVAHAGRILCLEEGHLPWEITADLDTVGPHDFAGRLGGSFTAHPKLCPSTGEMIGFGYALGAPHLTYHRVSAGGELVETEPIEIPAPVMMHDFNVTAEHVVFMDLPVVFDLDRAMAGTMPFVFRPDNGARLGVMPRDGAEGRVQWLDVEPCYVFHPLNAYDTGPAAGNEPGGSTVAGGIVVDVARYPKLWAEGTAFDDTASLWRWEIDPASGSVTETQLDDRPIEFGRVADDRVAGRYRYGYAVATGDPADSAIVKYDLEAGTSTAHDFGPSRRPGEFVFAPRDGGTAEDDGYLLGYVYDATEDRSDLVILDAADPAAEALAAVELPRRVPFGFHGSWIADPV